MLSRGLLKGYDERRLQKLLAVLFLALSIPTAALTWQAYSQLKWEAWYQYRNQAEELTSRLDASLRQGIAVAEARNFTDFSFLNAATNAKVLQLSPLAAYPVTQDFPGVIGYFQVDPDGSFSTPLLPTDLGDPDAYGLDPADFAQRAALASDIRLVLTENRLVRDRNAAGGLATSPDQPRDETSDAPGKVMLDSIASGSLAPESDSGRLQGLRQAVTLSPASNEPSSNEQRGFDELSALQRAAPGLDSAADADRFDDANTAPSRANVYGKVPDIKLDEELEKKNSAQKRELAVAEEERKDARELIEARTRRVEKTILPAAVPAAPLESFAAGAERGQTITTFESEVDPYQFSLLDSGHLVLFRNVWRDGSRYIQGLLIDQSAFSANVIESAFLATTLAEMSNLIVGYQDDVINVFRGSSYDRSLVSPGQLDGSLLYRSRLSAPFESLEMIFSINRLPPGPGAAVLAWTTVVIGVVFLGGFLALYRLGQGQIRLARQQQDFVSAVSHELKTPLTSIRMYGEMLKEGWADEQKRQQYYEYIHDEAERLTRLISNVLQLAKITRNEPQFDMKPTTVGELVDLVRSKIASQVERAGFEFHLEQDDASRETKFQVDDDCFSQIIINLVDNAIKFSRHANIKKIEFRTVLASDGRVVFVVRDYGPGIPRDQLKKIFQLFYRTESELTRETVGTGIGLAIVHQLTVAMNGSVDVINREPGVEFRIAFPT